MKRNKIIIVTIILFIIILIGYNHVKNNRMIEELFRDTLASMYGVQNLGLGVPISSVPLKEMQVFLSYENVDECILYVHFAAYESGNPDIEKLEFKDVEEYLSSEFNEDGSYRMLEGHENIRHFMDWYTGIGNMRIDYYWNDLLVEMHHYREINQSFDLIVPEELSLEQLKEFMKVINEEIELEDINHELMGLILPK